MIEEVTAEEFAPKLVEPSADAEYQIEGADNPQDNGTYITKGSNVKRVLSPEEKLKAELYQLQTIRRLIARQARKSENARAQKGRTTKSRRKRALEKASRKKNRR